MNGRSTCHSDYSEKTGDTDKPPVKTLEAITINVTQLSACFGHLIENSDKKVLKIEVAGTEVNYSRARKQLRNENG